ncbi:putative sodium bicarbonate transporter-like protein 11 [Triplophysa rosa]|uniref:Sodium bicarbonate transporter-like protein 11 n=1 Tax=Triplophysa rosa TaxID=992332 RepID=A0A9W7WJ43_TRIRA|nr:putative sodium bicarbonate transporter-like protein 11 [Triplophysa rosa]
MLFHHLGRQKNGYIFQGMDTDASGFGLLSTSRRYVKLMNFQEEVRALRDLDGFLAHQHLAG